MSDRRLVSVVIPILNEVDTLDPLRERLVATFSRAADFDFEVVLVDDGSTDGSAKKMVGICAQDDRFRLVELSRNFGHQLAITAGLDHASGDALVVIDGDLQDPPEVILEMLEVWSAGADVVYGVRQARLGESRLKRAAAAIHYRLLSWLSETDIPLDSGDFRLVSREVADALGQMRESNRYLRGMIAWLGFRQEAVLFRRDPRYAGEAKYDFRSLLKLSLDGITGFTDRPLRLASRLGLAVTGLAVLYALWIVVAKLLDPTRAFQGFSAIMVVILFLGGVQLFSIGIVGEYLARVYSQTKGRPLYVVSSRVGWPHDQEEPGRIPRASPRNSSPPRTWSGR